MNSSRVVALAFLLSLAAGCGGDNDVRVTTGPRITPRPGTFRGTTSTGTDITIDVGTIERIGFTCRDTPVVQVFSPPAPVLDDGTFDVSFDAAGRRFRVTGRFATVLVRTPGLRAELVHTRTAVLARLLS